MSFKNEKINIDATGIIEMREILFNLNIKKKHKAITIKKFNKIFG